MSCGRSRSQASSLTSGRQRPISYIFERAFRNSNRETSEVSKVLCPVAFDDYAFETSDSKLPKSHRRVVKRSPLTAQGRQAL